MNVEIPKRKKIIIKQNVLTSPRKSTPEMNEKKGTVRTLLNIELTQKSKK